jgi:hypothetical protein
MAAFVPCGGNKEAATALFVGARLDPRQAPPHPHTPGAGARLTPHAACYSEVCVDSKCVQKCGTGKCVSLSAPRLMQPP